MKITLLQPSRFGRFAAYSIIILAIIGLSLFTGTRTSSVVTADGVDWQRLESDTTEQERLKSIGETLYTHGSCIGCHPISQKPERIHGDRCPNHGDQNWFWGGTLRDIYTSIKNGIRTVRPVKSTVPCDGPKGVKFFPLEPHTRTSVMPRFDELLNEREIAALASMVRKLSRSLTPEAGEASLYAEHCAECHGRSGEGDTMRGAPKLSDDYWELRQAHDHLDEFIAYGGYILTARDRCIPHKGNFSSYSSRTMNAFGKCRAGPLSRLLKACYDETELLALALFVKGLSTSVTRYSPP